MALRLVFMGTPDFAVPTLVELAGGGHEIVAVYTRAPQPAGRGLEPKPSPVAREAGRLGIPISHAKNAGRAETADDHARARRRCRRGRRLRLDPAEGDFRCLSARLLQPACLAAAALARGGADPSRHHGRRSRDRRDGDEDGGRSRHRPDGDGASRADRPGCDSRGSA